MRVEKSIYNFIKEKITITTVFYRCNQKLIVLLETQTDIFELELVLLDCFKILFQILKCSTQKNNRKRRWLEFQFSKQCREIHYYYCICHRISTPLIPTLFSSSSNLWQVFNPKAALFQTQNAQFTTCNARKMWQRPYFCNIWHHLK